MFRSLVRASTLSSPRVSLKLACKTRVSAFVPTSTSFSTSGSLRSSLGEDRLAELGYTLPLVKYKPDFISALPEGVSETGALLPQLGDGTYLTGTVGKDVTLEEAKMAAEQICVNALANFTAFTMNNLDFCTGIYRISLYVNATDDFPMEKKQEIADSMVEFLTEVLKENGEMQEDGEIEIRDTPFPVEQLVCFKESAHSMVPGFFVQPFEGKRPNCPVEAEVFMESTTNHGWYVNRAPLPSIGKHYARKNIAEIPLPYTGMGASNF